jgi:hypothetical protein
MSFFVMPYTFTGVGRFKMVQKPLGPEPVESLQVERLEAEGHRALVFYCSVHLHLFETALNGPLFWAFDKKRHTHAPSQALRPSFWR